jgi:hypothetical protein
MHWNNFLFLYKKYILKTWMLFAHLCLLANKITITQKIDGFFIFIFYLFQLCDLFNQNNRNIIEFPMIWGSLITISNGLIIITKSFYIS